MITTNKGSQQQTTMVQLHSFILMRQQVPFIFSVMDEFSASSLSENNTALSLVLHFVPLMHDQKGPSDNGFIHSHPRQFINQPSLRYVASNTILLFICASACLISFAISGDKFKCSLIPDLAASTVETLNNLNASSTCSGVATLVCLISTYLFCSISAAFF